MSSQEEAAHVLRRGQHDSGLHWISLPGLLCLSVGGALYVYSLSCGRKARELERALDITKLDDLQHVLTKLPALVSIRGRVGSRAPKKCELCDKHAVIHEVIEEEVWRKQRSEGRTTYEPFETRKVFEECEWYLEDGSGVRVKVENALQAERLRSSFEYQSEFVAEDMSKATLGKVLMERAWQMTKHGIRKTERYLPVGAVVTCVGELCNNHIRTGPGQMRPGASQQPATTSMGGPAGWGMKGLVSGTSAVATATVTGAVSKVSEGTASNLGLAVNPELPFVLRKPSAGPSYITPLTLEQLKAAISKTARNCRWLAYIFGAAGAALILSKVVSKLIQRARERRIRQRVAAAEAARKARQRAAAQQAAGDGVQGSQVLQSKGGEEDYIGDRSPNTCVVCLEEGVDMVFTACGHLCCCLGCGLGLDRCPICRLKSRAIKVYKP